MTCWLNETKPLSNFCSTAVICPIWYCDKLDRVITTRLGRLTPVIPRLTMQCCPVITWSTFSNIIRSISLQRVSLIVLEMCFHATQCSIVITRSAFSNILRYIFFKTCYFNCFGCTFYAMQCCAVIARSMILTAISHLWYMGYLLWVWYCWVGGWKKFWKYFVWGSLQASRDPQNSNDCLPPQLK